MSLIAKENSVLKLVHPGGLVEIHTSPVTAEEVMRMNPKHCVARPDVFKYPWIVVRPESVLKPGSVFYIVPHHTMRKLMLKAQEKEESEMVRLKESKSVEIIDKGNRGKSVSKQGSSRSTWSSGKHSRVANCDQSAVEYSSVDLSNFNSLKEMSPSGNIKESVDTESSVSRTSVLPRSGLKIPQELVARNERKKRATTPNNRIMPRNDDDKQDELTQSKEIVERKIPQQLQSAPERLQILETPERDGISVQLPSKKTVDILESSQRVTDLKSCLKPKTRNTTLNLRVRFMLPGDEEKIMRSRLWLAEISPRTP